MLMRINLSMILMLVNLKIKDIYLKKSAEGGASKIDGGLNMLANPDSDILLKIFSQVPEHYAALRLGVDDNDFMGNFPKEKYKKVRILEMGSG